MEKKEKISSSQSFLVTVVGILLLYVAIFTSVVCYYGYYMQSEITMLKAQMKTCEHKPGYEMRVNRGTESSASVEKGEMVSEVKRDRKEREVISAEVSDWLKSAVGRVGPPGPQGPPGKDGRDGRDAFSLPAVEKMINMTVSKSVSQEYSRLVSSMPTYSGAVLTRWGRTVCPATSKLIYRGQMAGPDFRSEGGGVDVQCLPDDPDVSATVLKTAGSYSVLRPVFVSPYELSSLVNKNQHLPCVVCEATPRYSKLMIPGKSRCPSSWTAEYNGYLFSAPSQHGVEGRFVDNHSRSTYLCLDKQPENGGRATVQKAIYETWYGLPLYSVTASCEGNSALNNCPPYAQNTPLQCVVCTK